MATYTKTRPETVDAAAARYAEAARTHGLTVTTQVEDNVLFGRSVALSVECPRRTYLSILVMSGYGTRPIIKATRYYGVHSIKVAVREIPFYLRMMAD